MSVTNPEIALHVTRGACVIAGLFIAAVPALDDLVTVSYRMLAFVPPLFAVVLVGLYVATENEESLHRSALIGASIGVAVMFVPVFFVLGSDIASVVAIFVLGGPAVVGFAVFTLFAPDLFWTVADIHTPRWAPALLLVAPLTDPLVNAAITPVLSVGISITGLAWVATGLTLRRESDVEVGIESVP